MADENKPAFYPRVGRNIAKNFRSAQPAPFIDDPRAMDLPQYGDIDLSQPTKANLEMGRRMAERDAQLKRQQSADTSPLEKASGALQAVRLMGSALTQSINSLPTRIAKGDEAADKFMQERMYKPEQPLAYEYAGDIGNMLERLETEYKIPPVLPEAMALQYLAGPATSQATRGALQAGAKLERSLDPMVTQALERGGLQRDLLLGLGQGTQSNVIKPVGGNWYGKSVEQGLQPLKRNTPSGSDPAEMLRVMRERYTPEEIAKLQEGSRNHVLNSMGMLENDVALNKWVDSNLTNYVKKQMATPEDPVRKLAEEGVTHFPIAEDPRFWERQGELARSAYDGKPVAESDLAKQWENRTDAMIGKDPASRYQEMMRQAPGMFDESDAWVNKVPPETELYKAVGIGTPFNASDMGFDHIMDVLRQDVAAGRIRPDQLNKVSMEQAVRRTYEFDEEMAKRMREAAIKQTEGFPLHKEYPEGYKWIELTNPKAVPEGYTLPEGMKLDTIDHPRYGLLHTVSDPKGITQIEATDSPESALLRFYNRKGGEGYKALEDALTYEGNTMGHCVGGYCPDVSAGRSRIFSLRDAKGEPHVTVEVEPESRIGFREGEGPKNIADEYTQKSEWLEGVQSGKIGNDVTFAEWWRGQNGIPEPERPMKISQIKGKQNAAPKADYLPYVQDFVRSGNWSDVGDLKNTGLYKADPEELGMFLPNDINLYDMQGKRTDILKRAKEAGLFPEGQKYLTRDEWEDILRKQSQAEQAPKPNVPPEGMKRGGVAISHNPDTMMLELGNKRMKEGGSEDDTKPYFGGAGTKKYAAAKKRAEQADVNTLKDPRTYAAVAGLLGEAPDEMGFSVMHPDYQGIKEVADPAFYAGTALGVAPLGKALNAPFAAVGKALDPAVGRFVTKTMERGGLGADILTDMGRGTRSYAHLPHTEKSPDPTVGTRYKRTDIGGLVPRKDLDIEKLDKSSVKVFPWDASDRNKLVTEVSDIPLTNPVLLEGGDNYMRDIKHVKKRIAGASNEGIANRIQDRINQASVENQILGGTGKVFGFPIRMGDKAEHASTFPTDIAMDLLKQGNLSRKELDDLTNELRGMSFEAKGKGYFQNVAPIDSPEFLIQLREGIKGDKEKGITSVTDMNLRRALMDRLSQKKYQKRLEYNYPDLIGSVIADELKGVPKGWVGNVSAELDPFTNIRPSKSSTYSHDFGGKYYASMPNMPVEFLMPNTFEGIYLEMKALYPNAKPEALRNMTIGAMEKRKDKISEMIGPRSIDAVKLYQEGLKQGEFDPNDIKQIYDYMRRKKFNLKLENVKKAEGGAVTGDDLIIEERPL